MNANRFDALTRSLHARRATVQTLVGLGAGLGVARRAGAGADCLVPGSSCDPNGGPACCSAICEQSRKRKGKFVCAAAGEALGCTKPANARATGTDVHCPGVRSGVTAFCVNAKQGQPICVRSRTCMKCRRDTDCVDAFGVTARCVKCADCKAAGRLSTACVVPLIFV
ncbi:MAG TPA: hypothetical protein VFU81_11345 [Thermomicrobiales bacterium]|nr:hypothetical protein [Thermomicrobiales bacterium]